MCIHIHTHTYIHTYIHMHVWQTQYIVAFATLPWKAVNYYYRTKSWKLLILIGNCKLRILGKVNWIIRKHDFSWFVVVKCFVTIIRAVMTNSSLFRDNNLKIYILCFREQAVTRLHEPQWTCGDYRKCIHDVVKH